MNQNELIADLRNKLTPIKNYFALLRKMDLLHMQNTFSAGLEIGNLEDILEREKHTASDSIIVIEGILKNLEDSI